MNIQEAIDAPRFHHQWLPDRINYEPDLLAGDDLELLRALGHEVQAIGSQGIVEAILIHWDENRLEGAADPRAAGSAAVGW